MISHAINFTKRLFLVILSLSLAACAVKAQSLKEGNTPTAVEHLMIGPATATPQNTATSTYTAVPLAIPTNLASMTPVLPLVTITAINGNLYIRRGSGSDFNPTGVLLQGQTATALGRDILGEWLYIPIPSETGRFGWVSTLTIYSSIGGRMMDLPVVDSDLAVPAFIENCSLDNMIVQPSGVIIPPGNQFPNNIFQFDPGEYTIHDYDTSNRNNQGMNVDLREGEQFQITGMGSARHKCPEGQ